MKRLNPGGRERRILEQEGANNIVGGTNDALSFTVPGKGVGAGHMQVDAMSEEERAGGGVVEFLAVVALTALTVKPN